MSLRYFSRRLYGHGRHLFQKYYYSLEYKANISKDRIYKSALKSPSTERVSALQTVVDSSRKLILQNVLSKVSSGGQNSQFQQITKRLFFGDAVPLFAFVGVSLAAGNGWITREDELEGICWEIRNAVSKFQWTMITEDVEPVSNQGVISLDDIQIGKSIAKGCNAAVYSANFKSASVNMDSEINSKEQLNETDTELYDFKQYPFALKIMFNLDTRSSSTEILKAMYREIVPARDFSLEDPMRNDYLTLPPHPNIVAMYNVFADNMPDLPDSMENYPDALPQRLNPYGYGRNRTMFIVMKRYEYSLREYLTLTSFNSRKSVLLFAQLLEGIAHMNMNGIAHRDLKSDNILVHQVDWDDDNSIPVLAITDFGCCVADKNYGLKIPYTTDLIVKGGNMRLMAPEIVHKKPGMFSFLNYSKSDLWAAGAIGYEILGYDNPFYRIKGLHDGLCNTNYKSSELPKIDERIPTIISRLIGNILQRNPDSRLSVEEAANVCQLFLWAPSTWFKSERLPNNQEILQWLLCLTTKVLCEGRLTNQHDISSQGDAPSSSDFPDKSVNNVALKKSIRRGHPEYILISSFLCRAKLRSIKKTITWMQANYV